MNINLKFLLLGTTLSLIPTLTNAQCVATTDCATLGYTQTSCPNGKGIKCPFGNTFACSSTDESVCEKNGFRYECKGSGYVSGSGQSCSNKYVSCICAMDYEWKNGKCEKRTTVVLGKCTGYAKNCKIGQILNSDGTCSNNKVSGKTPIGVVVYISEGGCGQALALEDAGDSVRWNDGDPIEIPGMTVHSSRSTLQQDFDSCSNTQKVLPYGLSHMYPAVWQATNYMPVSLPSTKGRWCLPAAGIAQKLMDNYSEINAALARAGGKSLPMLSDHNHRNCTSSLSYNFGGWPWCYACNDIGNYDSGSRCYVRPVIAF